MLRKMESKGKYETAKRLRGACSQVFRYAIATARAERDVAADLRGALIAPQPVHRARYNLKPDYPMTAPAYSEQRRAMAKKIGLGRKPGARR